MRSHHGRKNRITFALVGALALVSLALVAFAFARPALDQPASQAYTPPTLFPSQSQRAALKAVSIGDSYSAGAGATTPEEGWVFRLAGAEGWNLMDLSRGGTGYLSSLTGNAKAACGLGYCPSYPEMIKDASAAAPDLVLVAGGRNDTGRDPGDESAAVRRFYTGLRAAAPKAKIVAVSPLWDASAPPAPLAAIAADVKAAAMSIGGTYLDIGQPLQGHPELLSGDGVHPNDAGHAAIAWAVQAKLAAAGL